MSKKFQLRQVITISVALFLSISIKAQQCRLVIDENFNQYSGSFRNYSESMVRGDFGSIDTPKGLDGRTKVGNGQIRAFFPKDEILGGATGFTWFDKLENNSTEEAVMQYRMKFSEGFQFTWGGKLPGLTGGTAPRGCNPNKQGGFSARQMWQRGGKMISYLYWPESDFRCGAQWFWKDENGDDLVMDTDKWYTIRQHIKLNRPGVRNGILEVFVDGVLVFQKTDIMFRKAEDNFKIDNAYWTTYVGGSTQIFAPTQDQYIWFDDFKVWINCSTPPGSTNQNPTVSMTSPADGAVFELGQTINLSANASDPDGNLDKINFKINNSYYSTDNTRPFEGTFTPTEAGTYKIAARAIDTDNAHKELFVTITVKEPNRAPTVSITSPMDGSAFELGQEITLAANASDVDGNLDRVNFKVNNVYYVGDGSVPYETTFTPTETGTYKLAARAIDADNAQTEVFVTITVKEPNSAPAVSITSPMDGAAFELGQEIILAANASDIDGNLDRINFKINNVYYVGDAAAPYETTFTPTETGTYKLAARAIDADNAQTEVYVTITVKEPNSAPTVSITSPMDGAEFELGQEITLAANASDVDGNLDRVNFKINDTYYGTDNTRPFETTFTPSEAGTYKLAVRAIDTEGLATEVSVSIEVRVVTGQNDLIDLGGLTVFPNPSQSGVFKLNTDIDWEVYNSQGIRISLGYGHAIDLSSNPKGMYFLKTQENVLQLIVQ